MSNQFAKFGCGLKFLSYFEFDDLADNGKLLDNAIDSGASNNDMYLQELSNKNLNITIVENGKAMTKKDILAMYAWHRAYNSQI